MPKSVNKVILLGNLGRDPEVKFTPQGTPVAKFSIATSERYKDKEGNWQERTEWHNIVLWQRLAEIAGEYLKKGSKVYIEGRLRTDSWDDRESGQKKYRTEIVGTDLVLLGGRGEGGGSEEAGGGGGYQRSRGASASGGSGPAHASEPTDVAQGTQITDEDIPF
jgi:single-strand DNA-binding protein